MSGMTKEFRTGYRCNLYFYIAEGIVVALVSFLYSDLPINISIAALLYIIISVCRLVTLAKMPNLNDMLYGKTQSTSFIVLHIFLSLAFDSAQVFMYAMCFSSIVNFSFINAKLAKYQCLVSFIVIIISSAVVSIYTGSQSTMMAFSFGSAVLLVINWVIISMASHIVYQYRINAEQERSLDDMLELVEMECYEAQKATRSKTQFLAQMSHEIRTPINTVIGMNEMILRECRDESILGYASETKTAAESLLSIINDILDITKIEAGKLTTISTEYSLASLINDVYNMVKFKAEQKNLEFIIKVDEKLPSVLIGDDIRIKQILINLLSNAVKYTHEGKVILEVYPVSEDEIYFGVTDTGIGIKEEDLSRLFVAFDRMEESRNRMIEGTGLGLNIASALLKMFGSELKVRSEYGKGSEFSFVIRQEIVDSTPLGKMDMTAKDHSHASYTPDFVAPDAKILVVDDNRMNRKVFINLLKRTKLKISEAESGMECIEKTEAEKFDIIFMDHMMPEMDGLETLRRIKANHDNLNRYIPIIALTANAVVGAKEFYLNAGFNGFLSKPIDPEKLEKTIASNLNCELMSQIPEGDTDSNAELPVINGIDWGYAMLHFGDRDALTETLQMFSAAAKSDAAELDGYYRDIMGGGSPESYRVKVHSMKSSAALIGIIQLTGMAMELEHAARNNDIDTIKSLHSVFTERWLSYPKLLRSIISDDSSPKKNAAEHTEDIQKILADIHSAAEDMDIDALDALSKQLDEYSFDDKEYDRIDQIKAYILNFDIEKLMECTTPVH